MDDTLGVGGCEFNLREYFRIPFPAVVRGAFDPVVSVYPGHAATHKKSLTMSHSLTFLGTLIYASVIYHRHRRAKARFLRSMQGKDLFPAVTDEETNPANSQRILLAPRNSVKEMGSGTEAARMKEAVEVTVLRELGGDWDVYELPATRSVRSSRGAKSVRSLKGVR